MKKGIQISILRTEFYEDLAKEYAVAELPPCPNHQAGEIFYSDGESRPEGFCEVAWLAVEPVARQLSRGELVQPAGTWMADDAQAVIACPDGVRPVIMLVEAIA